MRYGTHVGGELVALEEIAQLGTAVSEARRGEFTLGRYAARDALAGLGAAARPIPIGTAREPVWPDGIAGSIAHSRGLAVAVVGWRKDFAGIGVDLEPETRRAGDQTIRRVCTPAELEWINAPGDPGLRAMHVFCSKEAAYKALSALGGARLGFRDVEFFPWRGATLFGQIKGEAAPGAPRRFTARTLVIAGYIVACVLVPR